MKYPDFERALIVEGFFIEKMIPISELVHKFKGGCTVDFVLSRQGKTVVIETESDGAKINVLQSKGFTVLIFDSDTLTKKWGEVIDFIIKFFDEDNTGKYLTEYYG